MLSKPLGKLEQVSLREYWQDEARHFTRWLASEENLGLLSDTLGMELELEGVEVAVGPYKADIVAKDLSSDTRVVIENQLEKTNHDHLGKILTYASGLDAPVMIWIAREFSEEHRRALDFVNENASPELQCYGIEIQLWRIGNSVPAPQFKVVSSPNEYTSEIKADTSSGELTEAKALYLDLWMGFREYCKEQGTIFKVRKPRPQHWFSIAVGRSKFQISLTASMQNKRMGCEIYLRGKNAKTGFKLLSEKKSEIEAKTGALDWRELPDKQDCRIALFKYEIDVRNRSNWSNAYSWYKEKAEIFYEAFAPIIRSLPDLENDEKDNEEE
ncbi:MAG: DUF4268 domain-containing protein [Chloroflexota bacterium]|nr:DUF4268 domain-containing protein [Chloroflexota bacterium]